MKAHKGSTGTLYSLFNLNATRSGWLTPRPGRFNTGKETRYPFYRRLGGPQTKYGHVRKISSPPGIFFVLFLYFIATSLFWLSWLLSFVLPVQHTRHQLLCFRLYSNPQFQQEIGRKPSPETEYISSSNIIPAWNDWVKYQKYGIFFLFSCILHFIRTWFCVLIVLHFAFSFLLTTHNTNIYAPRGIYFFWIPSLALSLFPCFFFILIVLPSVFAFTVHQHKHPAPGAIFLYSFVVCTLSVIVSLSCLSCILPFCLLPATHSTNIHTPGGIQTRNTSKRSAADPRLRQLGHWDSIPGPSSP